MTQSVRGQSRLAWAVFLPLKISSVPESENDRMIFAWYHGFHATPGWRTRPYVTRFTRARGPPNQTSARASRGAAGVGCNRLLGPQCRQPGPLTAHRNLPSRQLPARSWTPVDGIPPHRRRLPASSSSFRGSLGAARALPIQDG